MTKNYLIPKESADFIYQTAKESEGFEYLKDKDSFLLGKNKDIEVSVETFNDKLSFLRIQVKLATNRKRELDNAVERLDAFTTRIFITDLKINFLEVSFEEKKILDSLDKESVISKALSL